MKQNLQQGTVYPPLRCALVKLPHDFWLCGTVATLNRSIYTYLTKSNAHSFSLGHDAMSHIPAIENLAEQLKNMGEAPNSVANHH